MLICVWEGYIFMGLEKIEPKEVRTLEGHGQNSAGSLTPALEGAPCSAIHPQRTKEKGRGGPEARKQEGEKPVFLAEKQKR